MSGHHVIVVGASAGGVEAIAQLARGLPAGLPAAVFVVIHFPTTATSVLPRILTRAGALPAHHAEDGEPIEPGHIYVAPPDYHLLLNQGFVRRRRGPKENGHRPAVDPLFRSAARAYGSRVIGVVLSGNRTTDRRPSHDQAARGHRGGAGSRGCALSGNASQRR